MPDFGEIQTHTHTHTHTHIYIHTQRVPSCVIFKFIKLLRENSDKKLMEPETKATKNGHVTS